MLHLDAEWDTFDAWCLSRGIDTESLTSRRLVHLLLHQLTDGADREQSETFMAELERIGRSILYPEESPIPDAAPPPGWRSDEDNWANIQAGLAGMGMIVGAVHRA